MDSPLASISGALLGAVLLNAVVIGAWAVRSRDVLIAIGHAIPVRELVPVVAFAGTMSLVTPASSGEVLRGVVLKRRHGVPYADGAAVILVERVWAIWLMAVSAAAAAAATLLAASPVVVVACWAAAAVAAFLPSVLHLVGFRPASLAAGLVGVGPSMPVQGRRARLAALLVGADKGLASVIASPRHALHFVFVTGIVFAAYAVQLWLVLSALGAQVSIVPVWGALGLATIAGVVSALPFGLGPADVVLAILLGAQGVQPADAGAAALLLRLVATMPLGIAGTVAWVILTRERLASSEADSG